MRRLQAFIPVAILTMSLLSTTSLRALSAAAPAPLVMQFAERTVAVSGATHRGKVVFFGIASEVGTSRPRVSRAVRRLVIATDSTGDGSARLDLNGPVPSVAIWIAVDLTTGVYASAPTPGYEPDQLSLGADLVKNDDNGQLKKVVWPISEMELLVVRPGAGVWHLYASKHSARDENAATTDPLRVDFEAMEPVGDSAAPPKSFRPGDVIVVIDPRWMRYGVLEVGK